MIAGFDSSGYSTAGTRVDPLTRDPWLSAVGLVWTGINDIVKFRDWRQSGGGVFDIKWNADTERYGETARGWLSFLDGSGTGSYGGLPGWSEGKQTSYDRKHLHCAAFAPPTKHDGATLSAMQCTTPMSFICSHPYRGPAVTLFQFQPHLAQSSCLNATCSPGKYVASGAAEVQRCVACESGKYQSHRGQNRCTSCPFGQFQPAVGKDRCLPRGGQADVCAGKYADKQGVVACIACEAGKYYRKTELRSVCASGYVLSSTGRECLRLSTVTKSWEGAKSECAADNTERGTAIVSFAATDDWDAFAVDPRFNGTKAWIGVFAQRSVNALVTNEGGDQNADGSPLTTTHWGRDEPSGFGTSGCAHLGTNVEISASRARTLCLDEPLGWRSSTGSACAAYGSEKWCTKDGGYGVGWGTSLGGFSEWAVKGVDAAQACCACGGGVKFSAAPAVSALASSSSVRWFNGVCAKELPFICRHPVVPGSIPFGRCTTCPPGRYQPAAGQRSCLYGTCRPGSYLASPPHMPQKCVKCSIGWYQPIELGASNCSLCPTGMQQPAAGLAFCTAGDCGLGSVLSGRTNASSSSSSSTDCEKCPAGKYSDRRQVPLVNAALATHRRGDVTQSSTAGGAVSLTGAPVAGRAADGSTKGRWFDGSLSSTKREDNPWWRVDLGARRTVVRVATYNRVDCCGDRLNGAVVMVGDGASPFDGKTGNVLSSVNTECGDGGGAGMMIVTGGSSSRTCKDASGQPLQGRYVFVILRGLSKVLTLAEVQVWALASTSDDISNRTSGSGGVCTDCPEGRFAASSGSSECEACAVVGHGQNGHDTIGVDGKRRTVTGAVEC